MANQKAFYFDANQCTGCKACQVACKDKWDLEVGVTWRRVAEFSAGDWVANADGTFSQTVSSYYTSVACNHCEGAPCVQVCPTQAMHKREDGLVVIDQDACIGCRYCEWACPYGAPQFSAKLGVMTKCNGCYDAVDAGENPACVLACPSRALKFGELEELRAKYGSVNEVAPLPPASLTSPSLVITPHRHAAPVGAGPVANPEEVELMDIKELSLVLFTVVMQMAVGAFCILGGVHFFATRRNGIGEADKLSDRALVAIGPLAVFALAVTLFHLGNPLNAPRAITNVGASWLSREIVLGLAFSVGGAVFAFLQWRKLASPALRNALALLVAAVGLVLVYTMSSVYRLPAVPAWDSLNTPISFFVTTFLLGALAMGAAFVANYWYLKRKGMDPKNVQYSMLATSLKYISLLAIALLGVQFIVIPLYFASLATANNAAATQSVGILFGEHGVLFALRLILLFVGAGLLSAFVYQMAGSETKVRVVGNVAYLAFALVLLSEILGRFLFYESMVRIGL